MMREIAAKMSEAEMAALILADRAHEGGTEIATTPSPGDQDSEIAAAALETAADRIVALASRLSSH